MQAAPDQVSRALKVTEGVLIQSLDEGSPAAKAGLLATRRGLGGIIAGAPLACQRSPQNP